MSPKGRKALWRISFVTAWSRPPRDFSVLVWKGRMGEGSGEEGRKGGREGRVLGGFFFTDKDGGF